MVVWRQTGILEAIPASRLEVRWRAKVGNGYLRPVMAQGRVFVNDHVFNPEDLVYSDRSELGAGMLDESISREVLLVLETISLEVYSTKIRVHIDVWSDYVCPFCLSGRMSCAVRKLAHSGAYSGMVQGFCRRNLSLLILVSGEKANGHIYFFLPAVCLAAMACFFFSSALLALACFCVDIFWFDFGDLSPIILIFFRELTYLRHV
jgi:hypothetical protein